VQLVSKIANLCGPDPPTSQTDDMRWQDRAMHYSALRGKNPEKFCSCSVKWIGPYLHINCNY